MNPVPRRKSNAKSNTKTHQKNEKAVTKIPNSTQNQHHVPQQQQKNNPSKPRNHQNKHRRKRRPLKRVKSVSPKGRSTPPKHTLQIIHPSFIPLGAFPGYLLHPDIATQPCDG